MILSLAGSRCCCCSTRSASLDLPNMCFRVSLSDLANKTIKQQDNIFIGSNNPILFFLTPTLTLDWGYFYAYGAKSK
jgi:hypothetical protein